MGELLTTQPRGGDGDEDGSGGQSPSRQSAGTGTILPPNLVDDGGGALYRIWENPSGVVSFRSRLNL